MKPAWILSGLLACAPLAHADVLDARRVPAEVRWVAHLDLEALARSSLFATIRAHPDFGAEIDFAEIEANFGLDPLKDVRGITVYRAGEGEEDVVAVCSGNARIEQATAKLAAMPGHRLAEVGGRAVHVLGEGADTWYAHVRAQPEGSDRVIVLAHGEALLTLGLAVLDGQAPSLATAAKPGIRAKPAPGSILFAAASQSLAELTDLGDEQASAVARLAQAFAFDVGEERGNLFASLVIDTERPEDALRVQQVFQGASALLALVGGDPETSARLQRLAAALRFEATGTRMTAGFRYPVAELFAELAAFDEDGDHDGDGDDR
jgi:hypothetical protein